MHNSGADDAAISDVRLCPVCCGAVRRRALVGELLLATCGRVYSFFVKQNCLASVTPPFVLLVMLPHCTTVQFPFCLCVIHVKTSSVLRHLPSANTFYNSVPSDVQSTVKPPTLQESAATIFGLVVNNQLKGKFYGRASEFWWHHTHTPGT